MNIGFFGDSYVDIIDNKKDLFKEDNPNSIYCERRVWAQILLDNLGASAVTSGVGGTNQYFAVKSWLNYLNEYQVPPDVAIFTFTWHHRLVHRLEVGLEYTKEDDFHINNTKDWSKILLNITQGKNNDIHDQNKVDELKVGFNLFYKHFYNDEQTLFLHELLIKYILELPNSYPLTKFIFLPNTELSLDISKKYFSKGVLMNFALGTISELEGENVIASPMIPSAEPKWGHLYYSNHLKLSNFIEEVINNYNKYESNLFNVDYSYFERKK